VTGAALAAASSGPSPLWYATRATGVVALVLLTATVILGIVSTARHTAPSLPRVVTAGLHRNISLLALALISLHILTTVADSYARIGITAAVIPFSSGYRRLWLGFGTVAFDLLLAVALTSLLRDRLSYRAWRAVHWLGYASWPLAVWHGLGTGSDSRDTWLLALDALCAASVLGATGWRLSLAPPGRARTAAIAAAIVLPLATAAFVLAGPLQPGWARRAGTPPALLGAAPSARIRPWPARVWPDPGRGSRGVGARTGAAAARAPSAGASASGRAASGPVADR
jgi:methionine sulfoxide reductase heme-binding subunit